MTQSKNNKLGPGAVLQKRYEIIKKIGEGGFGEVYMAKRLRFRQKVAVKMLRASIASKATRDQFEKEAALLFGLSHHGLAKVIDVFSDGDDEFLVMEYVEGRDLAQILEEKGAPIEPLLVLSWADAVLDTLEYLHQQKPPVVHRDIKPQNIKIGPGGRIVLLDFGLAKGASGLMFPPTENDADHLGVTHPKQRWPNIRSESVAAMSVGFSPLEQMVLQPTDHRSDLYSLGATIYALLSYSIPIDAVTRRTRTADGQSDPLLPIRVLNPQIPEALDRVVLWALALDPEGRPSSALELRQALRSAAGVGNSVHGIEAIRGLDEATVKEAPSVTDRRPRPKISFGWRSWRRPIGILAIVSIFGAAAIGVWILAARISPETPKTPPITQEGPNRREAKRLASDRTSDDGAGEVDMSTLELSDEIRMEFVRIPPGIFTMGLTDPTVRTEVPEDYTPHDVAITRPFELGRYEVTQAQWVSLMTENISGVKGDDLPVTDVTWDDARAFLERLNQLDPSHSYRFPTEAEWEYACRAGTSGYYAGGIGDMAWYANNSGDKIIDATSIWNSVSGKRYASQLLANKCRIHPVGQKTPNAWGLFDMLGNAAEWCNDWVGPYPAKDVSDPAGPTSGTDRVFRGGAWFDYYAICQPSFRQGSNPSLRNGGIGFRVVRVVK